VLIHGGEKSVSAPVLLRSTTESENFVEDDARWKATVEGDGVRVAFSKRSTKGTPKLVIRLWHGYTIELLIQATTIPLTPQVFFFHHGKLS